jgi:hypothetical protein
MNLSAEVGIAFILCLTLNHAYPSEKEAREAMDYYSVEPGTKPFYLTWEE